MDKQEECTNVEDNPFAKDVFNPSSVQNNESHNAGKFVHRIKKQKNTRTMLIINSNILRIKKCL